MNTIAAVVVALSLALQPTTQPAVQENAAESPQIAVARQVVKAAGGDLWPTVKRIKFTFNVESDGKTVATIKHDWDVRSGIDTVTAGDKTMTCNVYENKERTGDELAAFKRWTNDAYWLLMPLKLLDGGVKFGPLITTRDMPPSRGRMTMSFEGVGLTPGDQYDLSIDLRNHRIDHWTYRPNAETQAGYSWENYQDFNGLVLATEHKSDDGKRRIFFTDIVVERD
jgi:hypothetical protein